VLIILSDIITNKNVTSKKILSIFLMAVLLGSITTFSSHAKSNDELSQGNGILQNPQISKVLQVFTGFVPTLKEAQAIDNSVANSDKIISNQKEITSKHNIVLKQISSVTKTQKEIIAIKTELNILSKNPGLNSKKITTLNKYLVANITSLTNLSAGLTSKTNDLTSSLNNQMSAIDSQLTKLQSARNALNDEMNAHDLNVDSLSAKLASHSSQVNSFFQDTKATYQKTSNLVKQLQIDIKNNNTAAVNSDLKNLSSLNDTNNKSNETLNELFIMQESFESKTKSTILQIKDTRQKADEISSQMRLISNSVDNIHKTTNTVQNVIQVQTMTAKLTKQNPNDNGNLSVREYLALLEKQIDELEDILQTQITDNLNRLASLELRMEVIDGLDLETGEDTGGRMTAVENKVAELDADLNSTQDILGISGEIWGVTGATIGALAGLCGLPVGGNAACAAAFGFLGAILALISSVLVFL
jgi:chromosome segregation ATPase